MNKKERPDRLLLGLPSRWCYGVCNTYRIFSDKGEFCLACGQYRKDPFKPKDDR